MGMILRSRDSEQGKEEYSRQRIKEHKGEVGCREAWGQGLEYSGMKRT